jgi:hypothetical protein
MLAFVADSLGDGSEEPSKLQRTLDKSELLRLLCVLHFNGFGSGIYSHLAIVNHSCKPNCIKTYVAKETCSHIYATEPIKAGTEITINYLKSSQMCRASRQQKLWKQFQFRCSCSICKLPLKGGAAALEKVNLKGKKKQLIEAVVELETAISALDVQLAAQGYAVADHILGQIIMLQDSAGKALGPRHITLARADQVAAAACAALLGHQHVLSAKITLKCEKEVKNISTTDSAQVLVSLLEIFLRSLLSLRETQLLYLGSGPHPLSAASMSDLAQAASMLLSQEDGRKLLADPHYFGSFSSATKFEHACRAGVDRCKQPW